jgi:hypothetical protein
LAWANTRLQIHVHAEIAEHCVRQIAVEIAGYSFASAATRVQQFGISAERKRDYVLGAEAVGAPV